MSQRPSGYERKERDQYQPPVWVTNVLVPHIPNLASRRIWEPASGTDGPRAATALLRRLRLRH